MATVERELPSEKYTLVSNAILRDKALNATTFRVYCYLASLSPETSTNRYRIAGGLDLSSGTVQKALVVLEGAGYLERYDHRKDDGTMREPIWKLFNSKPEPKPVYKKHTLDNPPVSVSPVPFSPVSNLPLSDNCTPVPIYKTLPIKTSSYEKDADLKDAGFAPVGDCEIRPEEIADRILAMTCDPEHHREWWVEIARRFQKHGGEENLLLNVKRISESPQPSQPLPYTDSRALGRQLLRLCGVYAKEHGFTLPRPPQANTDGGKGYANVSPSF